MADDKPTHTGDEPSTTEQLLKNVRIYNKLMLTYQDLISQTAQMKAKDLSDLRDRIGVAETAKRLGISRQAIYSSIRDLRP